MLRAAAAAAGMLWGCCGMMRATAGGGGDAAAAAGMLRDDAGGCSMLLAVAGMLRRDDAGMLRAAAGMLRGCCWRRQGCCGFGIVFTESERENFFGPLGCRAAIDGAFCCGSASLGGGLGAGEAPPSKISVGSAMPRNSASLRGAARRRLNDATKKSLRQLFYVGGSAMPRQSAGDSRKIWLGPPERHMQQIFGG